MQRKPNHQASTSRKPWSTWSQVDQVDRQNSQVDRCVQLNQLRGLSERVWGCRAQKARAESRRRRRRCGGVWGGGVLRRGSAPPQKNVSIFGLQIATFGALWGLFLRFSGLFWTQTAVAWQYNRPICDCDWCHCRFLNWAYIGEQQWKNDL